MSTALWRKSSYSNATGGDCVEVAEGFLGAARWRTSSYSNATGGECVEVADNLPGVVPVRDSKVLGGPAIVIGAGAWAPFVAGVKASSLGG
ncbi:toxin [Streptomyces violascens]|nr:toxin [Streptomyces violascens]